jgi:ribose transport system ATP-binding protein
VTGRAAPVLELRGVSRRFGPVQVLFDVDLALRPGEVHALIGENGAGKSTAMKILGGYLEPSEGVVALDGAPVAFASSREAEARGIVLIHQEFNLAEQLTVEQNVFLGREKRRGLFLDHRAMQAKTRALLDRLEARIDPRRTVATLSVPDKQMVEIAKALSRNARVLVMDEPTAALTNRETEVLLGQIDRLRAEGTAILYTSHKLDEVARIADRVTVLRDGHVVLQAPAAGLTEDRMAAAMVGREMKDLYPPKRAAEGGAVLEVRRLTVPGVVEDASFTLRKGEILGFAGLVGAGRTELMEGLVGLRAARGEVVLEGRPLRLGSVAAARAAGLVYLTEDRKGRGLLLEKSLRENLTLLALDRFTAASSTARPRPPRSSAPSTTGTSAPARARWRPATSRAATSRSCSSPRPCWPNRASSSSTSRLAASTSAPSSRSTPSSTASPPRAAASSSSPPRCRR